VQSTVTVTYLCHHILTRASAGADCAFLFWRKRRKESKRTWRTATAAAAKKGLDIVLVAFRALLCTNVTWALVLVVICIVLHSLLFVCVCIDCVDTAWCSSVFLSALETLTPKFALASRLWKRVQLNRNFITMCRMASVHCLLIYLVIW